MWLIALRGSPAHCSAVCSGLAAFAANFQNCGGIIWLHPMQEARSGPDAQKDDHCLSQGQVHLLTFRCHRSTFRIPHVQLRLDSVVKRTAEKSQRALRLLLSYKIREGASMGDYFFEGGRTHR